MINKFLRFIEKIQQRLYTMGFRSRFKDAERLYIHRSARISGDEYIKIGKCFTGLVGLRLEAVTRYNGVDYFPSIIIKDNVTFNDYVHIGATHYVEIGNNVLVASKVFISDHIHGSYSGEVQSAPSQVPSERPLTENRKIIIEDNVWIGESVSILAGVRIGYGSIIGAHSVVTKDIPPMTIAVGTPAKPVKKYDETKKQWDVINA